MRPEEIMDEQAKAIMVKVAWQAVKDYKNAWRERREALIRMQWLRSPILGEKAKKIVEKYMKDYSAHTGGKTISFKKALINLRFSYRRKKDFAEYTLKECEEYFRGDLFATTMDLDGEEFIERLKEQLRRGSSYSPLLDREIRDGD